jgi:hypothetical protein
LTGSVEDVVDQMLLSVGTFALETEDTLHGSRKKFKCSCRLLTRKYRR